MTINDIADSTSDYTITTSGSSTGAAGSVWVGPSTTTANLPYTISSGATITSASTWAPTDVAATCRFCDKQIEIGLIIQSKDGKKNNICIKCAKDYMGGEKIKEILDLVEPLATMAEVAKV
jgi:hypothetical protein